MSSRRVAAVHLSSLPVESLFEDRERPVAVREEVRGQRVLVSVSDEARRRGIRPGMKESEGKARDLDLWVESRDISLEQSRLDHAAQLLFAYGPEVEIAPPDLLFVEIGRSRRAIAKKLKRRPEELTDRFIAESIEKVMERAGHRVTVAIAKDPDTARTFAEHLSRLRYAPPPSQPRLRRRAGRKPPQKKHKAIVEAPRVAVVDDAPSQLAKLPLEAITWTDRRVDPDGVLQQHMRGAVSSLALLGVKDVGRFVGLPASQVNSRFGEAGAQMSRRARAEGARPLRAYHPPERTVETFELNAVTEDLEPILFVLKRLFGRLEDRLSARARAVRSLLVHFLVEPPMFSRIENDAHRKRSSKHTETVELKFARATRRASTMLALARERMGASLPGAVLAVTVEAATAETDHGAQLDLFRNHQQRLEEVSELVGRLQAALGEGAIFSPTIADTHRPEAAWKTLPFDIEVALEEPPQEKPVVREGPQLVAPLAEQGGAREHLPSVDAGLAVTSIPDTIDESETTLDAKPAWPKPIQRKPEDEPLPPLPPRPLELLAKPERIELSRESKTEDGVIRWRGRRYPVVHLGATERLEAEWWTQEPIARDYWVAEIADGRRLWLYAEPTGAVFVHGIFD